MRWTDLEVGILKEYYPSTSWDELLALLPNRNMGTINYKARTLRLSRRTAPNRGNASWSAEETAALIEMYSREPMKEIREALPGKTQAAIYAKAHTLGLERGQGHGPGEPMVGVCPTCGGQMNRDSMQCRDCYTKKITRIKSSPDGKKRLVEEIQPIKFKPWEKQVIVDLAATLSMAELKFLLPRRTQAEIRRMAEAFGVTLL